MKIAGRFGQEGDGRPIEEGFFDGHGAPADGTAAFFPIIQMREPGPWEPIGTGFFISNNGLFATAKHVVLDEQGRLIEGLAGVQLLRSDNRVIVRQAKKIAVHPRADVAIGFLFDREFAAGRGQTVNKCFALSRDLPAVGSKVATIAFPKSQLTEDQGPFPSSLLLRPYQARLRNIIPAVGIPSCFPEGVFEPAWISLPGRAVAPSHSETVGSLESTAQAWKGRP